MATMLQDVLNGPDFGLESFEFLDIGKVFKSGGLHGARTQLARSAHALRGVVRQLRRRDARRAAAKARHSS